MNTKLNEVKEWIQSAELDLLSSRILLKHKPPVLETACFHCQQVVEKSLKAFLVWRSVPFEKVHNLTYLLDICEAQEADFADLRDETESLSPYAVELRYPSINMKISQEEAQEALDITEKMWSFVLKLLPDKIRC